MRLLNYFYVSMKTIKIKGQGQEEEYFINMNEKIEEDLNFDFNFHFNISNDEMSLFENYLSVYLELTSKDLLADKIQANNEIKLVGDDDVKLTNNCKKYY